MPQLCPACNHNNRDISKFCFHCGSPLIGLLGSDTLLSNLYQIKAVLAYSQAGATYSGQNIRDRLQVIIQEFIIPSPADQAKFQREAAALTSLNYPHLPAFIEQFSANGRQYLATAWVAGQNLAERLALNKNQPLPEPELLLWIDQVLNALAYCHRHGVCHRDIKPQNIIITPEGKVMLVGFGLNKPCLTDNPTHSPGLPPDNKVQAECQNEVYEVGAALYYLLTGLQPPSVQQRMAEDGLLPLRQINATVSAHVERAVAKAMALPPRERFQSIEALQQALRPPPPHQGRERLKQAIPLLVGGITTTVLLAVIAAFSFYYRQPSADRPASPPAGEETSAAAAKPGVEPATLPAGRATITPTHTTVAHRATAIPITATPGAYPALTPTVAAVLATSTPLPTYTPATPALIPTLNIKETPVGLPAATAAPQVETLLNFEAPRLANPEPDLAARAGIGTTFEWYGLPLPENHAYEIRIWRGEEPHYGAFDAKEVRQYLVVKDHNQHLYSLSFEVGGAYSVQLHGSGEYYWTAAVVQLEPYQRVGPEAQPRRFCFSPEDN